MFVDLRFQQESGETQVGILSEAQKPCKASYLLSIHPQLLLSVQSPAQCLRC